MNDIIFFLNSKACDSLIQTILPAMRRTQRISIIVQYIYLSQLNNTRKHSDTSK